MEGRNYNALEVVFGLALPRELRRVIVIGHGRKQLVFAFDLLFHSTYGPLRPRRRSRSRGARTSDCYICSRGYGCCYGGDRGDGSRCHWLCPLYWGCGGRTCSGTRSEG